MKNSIFFSNPEANEPQNLLKTEAYAKGKQNLTQKELFINRNEEDSGSLFYKLKPNLEENHLIENEKIPEENQMMQNKKESFIDNRKIVREVFADEKHDILENVTSQEIHYVKKEKDFDLTKIYNSSSSENSSNSEDSDFSDVSDEDFDDEIDAILLKKQYKIRVQKILKEKYDEIKREFPEITVFPDFNPKVVQDLFYENISIKNMEFPKLTVLELIKNVGIMNPMVINYARAVQKDIVSLQLNQKDIQNKLSLIHPIIKYLTMFPRLINQLRKKPEFQVLRTFQEHLEGLKEEERYTITNHLQVKLQTSFQKTFFKKRN
jgi:hypothetical protein